jgi:hypothetical protein
VNFVGLRCLPLSGGGLANGQPVHSGALISSSRRLGEPFEGDEESNILWLSILGHEIDHHGEGTEVETVLVLLVQSERWSLVSGSPDATGTSASAEESDVMEPSTGVDVGLRGRSILAAKTCQLPSPYTSGLRQTYYRIVASMAVM